MRGAGGRNVARRTEDFGSKLKRTEDSQALEKTIELSTEVTGSQAIVDALLAEGVDTIFGYPGGAIMPLYDALYDARSELRHILVRHEQGATHAAEGYTRATGKVGVCLATSGPGATNLVTGIADAMMDSIPMVCITGNVASNLLGTDAFQETDVISVTIPITKWNYQVTDPSEIPEVLEKAFYVAQSGRPGPVLVDITKDAQQKTFCPVSSKKPPERYERFPLPKPSKKALLDAATLMNSAKKPLLLVGHGVLLANAERELLEFAEKSGIPVACTLHGLSGFPTNHRQYVGMLGMHGNYGPNRLTNEADLLIAVGMRFDDRVTGRTDLYAKKAKVIHLEVDPAEVNKIVPATVGLIGDAKATLASLLPAVNERQHLDWLREFELCYAQEVEKVIGKATDPQEGQIKMSEAVHQLSELTGGDAIVVADVGQHQMMTARYFRFKQTRSFFSSGGLGTMGFALPAAIGAKIGDPTRDVIAIAGDGGFQMTLQELATVAQENISVKVMILNNSYLGMVRQWQQLFFDKRYSFVNIEAPDFVKLSEAFGIQASRVSNRSDLKTALAKMMSTPGPYVLEVVVEQEENVFPMVPSGASVSDVRLA